MQFDLFTPYEKELFCAVSDRHGGVSPRPYDTLNIALHVGDEPKNVLQNRIMLAEAFDYLPENLIYMEQTHSANIAVIEHAGYNKIADCDAIVTAERNIPLMVMVADCIPAMLYDPKKKVIAAAHAGRNGTFAKILPKTVLKMHEAFQCDPADIHVALGPSIHPCCYEVGSEIADITVENFGEAYVQRRNKKTYLDLQRLNRDQLLDTGVTEAHMEISPVCTCCTPDYFSYRGEGTTGRFAGVIKLK